MEILEIKIYEIKISLNRINSLLDTEEEKISEVEFQQKPFKLKHREEKATKMNKVSVICGQVHV